MSNPPLIVGLGGTLREKSYSRAALREALRLAEMHGACVELLDLRELNLPMFVPSAEVEEYPAAQRARIAYFLDVVRRADAMIWSSPPYHGTMSGVLKNALDFIELMHDDPQPYLAGRTVGLITLSDPHTFAAMTTAAHELRAWVAPTRVMLDKPTDFTPELTLSEGRAMRRVTRMVGELIEFAAHRRKH